MEPEISYFQQYRRERKLRQQQYEKKYSKYYQNNSDEEMNENKKQSSKCFSFSVIIILLMFIFCCIFYFMFYRTPKISFEEILKEDEHYTDRTGTEIHYIDQFKQPTYSDKTINTIKFNYEGKCREIFKYKPNNFRDLIFMAGYFEKKSIWNKQKKQVEQMLSMLSKNVPYAAKVFVLYGDSPDGGLVDLLESFDFEVIRSPIKIPGGSPFHAAVQRYIDFENYLIEYQKEYDRVAISDFKDVMWFADGFQTVSQHELVLTQECSPNDENDLKCMTYSEESHFEWMKTCFGDILARKLRKENQAIVDNGFIIGGIEPMMKLMKRFTNEIRMKKRYFDLKGFDQAILNYLYYKGMLNDLPIVVNKYSQRIAFQKFGGYKFDERTKVITDKYTGCSPVVRHKLYGNDYFSIE